MTSIFELAAFYAERRAERGDFPPPQVSLRLAAQRAVEGYADLEEANGETLTRFDGYGNEIAPSVACDAVRCLRADQRRTVPVLKCKSRAELERATNWLQACGIPWERCVSDLELRLT